MGPLKRTPVVVILQKVGQLLKFNPNYGNVISNFRTLQITAKIHSFKINKDKQHNT